MLFLCTKHVHFKFNDEIYIQCDGVAMGSPFGPLFANIFMISLEENILPKLESYLCNWRRYIDDIFAYVLPEKIDLIIHELNSYHPNLKFTYELELDNKLAFLDVCVTRTNKNEIETSVYRKAANTSIYINWYSHAPSNWRTGTPRNLTKRAKPVSSTKLLLRNEIDHIWKVFIGNNDYPHKVVNHIIDQELLQPLEVETVETKKHDTEQKIQPLVPYSGKQGHQLLLKMKKQLKRNLSNDIKTMISYRSTKLSTKFPVKDKTDFQHKHNVVYYGKCPNEACTDDYVDETKRRTVERIKDHNSKDNSSHLLKHACENGLTHVWKKDFQILSNLIINQTLKEK